ncbi:ribosome-associated translation inhibitor RaiA [Sphingomonas lutea]|uniref:Ribosome hibernation promoting factor n=1 Tax=Sphingomonas lutea TaxID=1045317 RepID=A0A7G9SII3_9SPHN|nr:ribosome-associated translation inhibitor RaiA [Sphingomonas lutea]QNN67658.1 ribosome-associated translation inhibitor RaiA [Sphingomonas lutea]
MDVRVAGHQVDTPETLRDHAVARVEEITEKYFTRAFSGNVTFGRGPNNDFTCDIVVPVVNGVVLKASHRAPEAQMAFNGAADRIEKQLRRYGKRLKERRSDNGDQALRENAGYTIFATEPTEDRAPAAPAIVAETRVDIPDASVSDAVMLLDLRNTTALMFRNSGTGEFNMIYRREDGNIGWVEPQPD